MKILGVRLIFKLFEGNDDKSILKLEI